MGFCRISFIGYMLCTYIAGTERNYHSQWIIVLKILICVYPHYGCYFSADLREEHQGVLYANVFRENNNQIYFNRDYKYGGRYIWFLLLFVHRENRRI